MIYVTLIVIQVFLAFMDVVFHDVVEIVHSPSLDTCSRCRYHCGIDIFLKDAHNCMAAYSVHNWRCLHVPFLWPIFHMEVLETCDLKTSIRDVIMEVVDDGILFLFYSFLLFWLQVSHHIVKAFT